MNNKTEKEKTTYMQKADLLKALAHPVRLCILKSLHDKGEMNVSNIISCMDVSQSSVSQHLSVLRRMGIVEGNKQGNEVFYSCRHEEVKEIISVLFA